MVSAVSTSTGCPLRFEGWRRRAPKLDKSHTVAVLGTARTPDWLNPAFEVLENAAYRLSKEGYDIITGGSDGANKAANTGAVPRRSFAVHVNRPAWRGVKNRRAGSRKPLFRDYASVHSGPARTELLDDISGFVVIAPGGAGSLQELGVTLEAMAYGDHPPEKVILLDAAFWADQMRQLRTMVEQGLLDAGVLDRIACVAVDPQNPRKAADALVEIITGREGFEIFG